MDSSELFFDSAEYLVSSMSEGEESDYGVWVNAPGSVRERRESFLQGMGFAEFAGPARPEGERLRETDGAESISSWDRGSDSVCCSRESGNGADELIDESSDEDQEDESEPPSPSSSECSRLIEEEQAGVKGSSKRRLNRWWSFIAKRTSSLAADSFSGRLGGSPVLSRVRVRHNQKRLKEFTGVYSGQEIRAHSGIIRSMKFSTDGRFLASGGSDGVVRVWRVNSAEADFSDFVASEGGKVKRDNFGSGRKSLSDSSVLIPNKVFWIDESPVREFVGHTGDILDLAWSNSNHLLSSSMDKTVRLWHLGSEECLDIFRHTNYVTCVQFNPVHENYFISGSIDGKVRVWGVSERRVVDWADVRDVITAICYRPDGQMFVVGSVVGSCHFFDASGAHLHLDRIIDIEGRKKASNRITSIQFSREKSKRVVITSEDGKIRVIDGSDIVQKYRGLLKSGSQLSASFTSSGKHIVSVGDDSRVYVWNYDGSSAPPPKSKNLKSVQSCEHFHSEAVSVALPWPSTGTDRSLLGIKSSKSLQYSSRRFEYPSEARVSSDRFSIGNWFSIEGPCLGAATWPEEKLPLWEFSDGEEYKFETNSGRDSTEEEAGHGHVRVSETWGSVIVTASFDGKIRTFHNYGLPVRL